MSPLPQISNLKFLLDENVDVRVGYALRALGYAIVSCSKGISDAEVLARAKKDRLVLITNDTDFANLPLETIRLLPGLIIVRIHPPSLPKTAQALETLLHALGDKIQSRCILLGESGFTMV